MCSTIFYVFFHFSLYIVRKSRVYKLQCFPFESLTLVRMGQNMKYLQQFRPVSDIETCGNRCFAISFETDRYYCVVFYTRCIFRICLVFWIIRKSPI